MKSCRTILFVFHEANRTGATIVLYRYVQWLHAHGDFKLIFVLLHGGPLVEDLSKMGKIIFWKRKNWVFRFLFINVTLSTGRIRNYLNLIRVKKLSVDLIVANTITSDEFVVLFKKNLRCPVIWYIHELGLATKVLVKNPDRAVDYVDLWMANSISTKTFLRSRFNIPDEKCVVCYPPIIIPEDIDNFPFEERWRGKFVIGSVGSVISRKGYELFIILALFVNKLHPSNNFHFVWVGDNTLYRTELEYDIQKCGLDSCLEFVGEVSNPFAFYKQFNVFVSTSKEESFGLACAEAISVGIPTIGFDGTEGLEEIIIKGKGKLVPYMDVLEMAKSLIELSHSNSDEEIREKNAIEFRQIYSNDKAFKLFLEKIESCLV